MKPPNLWIFCIVSSCLFLLVCSLDDENFTTNPSGFLRAARKLQTETCSESCCLDNFPHDSTVEDGGDESNPLGSLPFGVQIVFIGILISLSAIFSGLTLGLMSLDKTGLEIVMEGDDPQNAAYAKRIYPIRKNGNLLLCTLLLGNVAVNALLSILLGDIAGGLVGFLASTFLIVIFGEIIPQAMCSRYALYIGSKTVPLVRVIMFLLYPLAFPLGAGLDKMLGKELATTYSSAEMMKLLQIHVDNQAMDQDTAVAMKGALQYKDLTVSQVMTSMQHVFMLSVEEKLNFETIAQIFKTGYSRIPVYEVSKNNVIGLLFVKDLIFIDPEDETRVAEFVHIFGRGVHVVWPDDTLGDVLRELKRGKSHMALVRDVNNTSESSDPFYELKGIITLEDIIEEILGDEIVDETDVVVENTHQQKVDREETFKWARLRLLDRKIVDETLTIDESKAVTAHLETNYAHVVEMVSHHQLLKLVSETHVSILPTVAEEIGEDLPRDLLYERGQPSDSCTLILSGKVTVIAGTDKFRSTASSWTLLGSGALGDINYTPDFDAFVSSGPCRCIRLDRSAFSNAIDKSTLEKIDLSDHTPNDDGPVQKQSSLLYEMESTRGDVVDVSPSLVDSTRKKKLLTALSMFKQDKSSADELVQQAKHAKTPQLPPKRAASIAYIRAIQRSMSEDKTSEHGDDVPPKPPLT